MLFAAARHVRRLVVCFACVAVLSVARLASAAPAGTVPQASPSAAWSVQPPASPAPTPGAQVADLAQQYVGSPYTWGGTSPNGFDCTGFVLWVFGQFGVSLPHNEAGQLASGARVGADELQPGDVLVFANTYRRGLSHVGIYVGDGRFVHAVDERRGVLVSSLWDGYWGPRLVGASRTFA